MLPRLFKVLPGAVVLMALTSCSDGSPPSAQAIESAQVANAVAQLDALVADVLARSGIPGMAVAVVHRGKTVYAKGFGVRRLGAPDLIDVNTVFQLASLSKSVGATVVATQVGKGIVSWDTPVVKNLPWFALKDPASTAQVTVGDLYAHRSGLPDHAGDDLEDLGYDRRQVLERLRFLPVEPLRTHYAYTNFGLTAAAQSVAVASGIDWESLSDQVLYRPLGMNATSSRYADFMARSDRAYPHIRLNGVFQPGPQRQPDPQSPAGGVSSSVSDMANWMTLVLQDGKYREQQIIPGPALAPAISPQMLTMPPAAEGDSTGYYGYGFNVSVPASGSNIQLSHSGAFIMGASTSFALLPSAGTGIVVLTNALPVGAAETISATYMDLIKLGHSSRDWFEFFEPKFAEMTAATGKFAGQPLPENPVPPLPPQAYIGTYANDYFGDAEIQQQGGDLILVMGPSKHTKTLQHWSGNVFVFEPGGEMATPGSRSAVTFAIAPGGTAQNLTIEMYEATGFGTLARR
ncbi:serine hydrolase [Eoetvoesiella caeni]